MVYGRKAKFTHSKNKIKTLTTFFSRTSRLMYTHVPYSTHHICAFAFALFCVLFSWEILFIIFLVMFLSLQDWKMIIIIIFTYVQSDSWPQKKRVCRRWSPMPSCCAPCVYTHSGSPDSTHDSKSFFSHCGSGNGKSGNARFRST